MSARKIKIDWKMIAGFAGLLFLIIAIGAIGLSQIQRLRWRIDVLAKTAMPMQNAVLEMRADNSKYAMGIRSYMFWRGSHYLDSAAIGEKLNLAYLASQDFDKQLALYGSFVLKNQQKEWIQNLKLSQSKLRLIGDNIISFVDKLDSASVERKKFLEESINRQMMDFERNLFEIDVFLDNPLQDFNLQEIDRQLVLAEAGVRHSVAFLLWSIAVSLALGAQMVFLIYLNTRREKEAREALWRKVARVEEEERNNLAFQVHDQMGQDLSALKIYLSLIEKEVLPEAIEQKEKIEKVKKILSTLIDKTHNISELLRPPELDDLGLSESIAALIAHYKEMTGRNYNYTRPAEEIKVAPEHSLVLYRVAQEALTNIAKHSNANNIEVALNFEKNNARLFISDDGEGFDYDKHTKTPSRRKEDNVKLGLTGLRERLELLGGKFIIHTKPGRGTRLEVFLPIR